MRARASTLLFALSLCACRGSGEVDGAPVATKDVAQPAAGTPSMRDPASLTQRAPDAFKARFTTTKGEFVLQVRREWSPLGADRFYNLVKSGFYDGVKFFRVVDGFMAQFGVHGSPDVSSKWARARIADDPPKQSNKRGFVSFAMAGPGSRTTQIFINLVDNARLDGMGFAPFAEVTSGMDVVDKLHKGYGEGAPAGSGPSQGRIQTEGNAYLERDFPLLDAVKTARVE